MLEIQFLRHFLTRPQAAEDDWDIYPWTESRLEYQAFRDVGDLD